MNIKEMLGEGLYNQLSDDKKKELNNWIPKTRFDEVVNQKNEFKTEIDNLNKQLTDNNKQLETFKGSIEGNEELKKQLEELQNANANTQKEYSEMIKNKEQEWKQREIDSNKKFTVREKLLAENVKKNYIDMAMNNIDLNKVVFNEDGSFSGVTDIVGSIKQTYPDLFGENKIIGTGVNSGSTVTPGVNLEELRKKASMTGSLQDRIAYSKAKQESENQTQTEE